MGKKKERLNSKQRKLVEKHHDFIDEFMTIYDLEEDDVEDWYGVCAVALCEAAMEYQSGDFIDFAYDYLWRAVEKAVKSQTEDASDYDFRAELSDLDIKCMSYWQELQEE